MATTINSLGVNLGMDAKGFIDGAKTSRSEARLLAKDIEAARSPTEQLAVEQDRLTKALKEGAISEEVYNRLLEDKRQKLLGAGDALDKQASKQETLFSAMSKAGNIVAGISAGFDLVGSAVGKATELVGAFTDRAAQLDDFADKAKKIGVSFNELGALEFSVGRIGGADAAAALEPALQQLMKRGLIEPGESAIDAFKRVAAEINGISDQTERAQAAVESFGKGGMELLGVFTESTDELDRQASYWERNKGLSDAQLEGVGEFNDRLEDITFKLQGIVDIYVADLAPAATLLLETLTGTEASIDSLRGYSAAFTESIVAGVGYAKDLYEVYEAIRNPLDLGSKLIAVDFTSAEDMLGELYEKRQQLQTDAMNKAAEREAGKAKSVADAKLEAEKKRLDAQKKLEADYMDGLVKDQKKGMDEFEKERKKSIEQAEKDKAESDKQARKSIESAEKSFENERKERDKMRTEVAKGPGSGMEAGSDELVKFMADQANAQIAADVMPDQAKPTEEELLEEARRQRELSESADKKMDDQITLLRKIADKETPQIQRAR